MAAFLHIGQQIGEVEQNQRFVKGNSGGPIYLIAYGGINKLALRLSGIPGALVEVREITGAAA